MKKSLSILAALVLVACGFLGVIGQQSAFAATYDIFDCDNLRAIDDNMAIGDTDTYVLQNDIVCDGDFASLDWTNPFSGTFDGDGYRIYGLDIDETAGDGVGLFSRAESATFQDLYLEDGRVFGLARVGSLVGFAEDITVSNVHSSVDVEGTGDNVGGLIGDIGGAASTSIADSSTSGEVDSAGIDVGGLVGRIQTESGVTSTIRQSWSTSDVTASNGLGYNVGGLVGEASVYGASDVSTVELIDTYTTGVVSGENSFGVGGLLGGANSYGSDFTATITIAWSYSSASVEGFGVGGLLGAAGGLVDPNAIVQVLNSFAVGPLQGSSGVGGVVGTQSGTDHFVAATTSAFDSATTGVNVCMGGGVVSCTNNPNGSTQWRSNTLVTPKTSWDFAGNRWLHETGQFPVLATDVDHDGISNAVENAGPNDGDANNNGVLDSVNSSEMSFVNDITGEYILIGVAGDHPVIEATTEEESEFDPQDDEYDYPDGFMNFRIHTGVGDDAFIELVIFGAPAAADVTARKFNTLSETYTTVIEETYGDVEIDSQTALFTEYIATDGGELDDDGEENGFFSDPLGFGVLVPTEPPTTTTTPTTSTVVPAPGANTGGNSATGSLPATGASIAGVMFVASVLVGSGLTLVRKRRAGLVR